MISLKQAVIVEGKYDKIKLSSILDALIITTDGFGIFKDKEKRELIRTLAEKRGIVIMTDSDSAGFMIRSYIKSFVPKGSVTNVFIPDILGKERRKAEPSKEGKLGVEGVPTDVLSEALRRAGLEAGSETRGSITKMMLYEDGFIGGEGSSKRREMLKKKLSLPERMSAAQLPEVLSALLTVEEYHKIAEEIKAQSSSS